MVTASTGFCIVTMAIAIAVLFPHQASSMALATLCSGQGRQHSNMFGLTGDAPEAASLFLHAASLLGGNDPRDYVHGESRQAQHRNRAGQILCTVQALAAAVALRDAMPGRMIVTGRGGHLAVGTDGAKWRAGVARPCSCRPAPAHTLARTPRTGRPWLDWASGGNRSGASRSPSGFQTVRTQGQHAPGRRAAGSGSLRNTASALVATEVA